MNWLCQICGYDYYNLKKSIEIVSDPCLTWLDMVEPKTDFHDNQEESLQKLDDSILSEYIQIPNRWYLESGVSYETQKEFEVGFSVLHDRIMMPIRDEIGNLVGVKGRTIHDPKEVSKFFYPYPTSKTLLLYGLYKTLPYIKEKNEVIVLEAEKGVMIAWSMGIRNCVAIGGHKLSMTQVMKLEKLGVDVVLALDKGVRRERIAKERDKFLKSGIYTIWDKDDLLNDKEAPVDRGVAMWNKLYSDYKWKIK